MANLSKKAKMILPASSKSHIILWKKTTKNYIKRIPSNLEKLHPDFSEEGKEEVSAMHPDVFCQNLGIIVYILENYSNFENKFLFTNGSILEIND